VVTKGNVDPGRDYLVDYARDLARTLKKIKADPAFSSQAEPARKRR
jgi:hypothetical protein